jgi:hypothetical protein
MGYGVMLMWAGMSMAAKLETKSKIL